ncbi:TonB-dependent receptor [Methylomonas montana]|uniref:TonB-dependent receptor n=1 Tax=Methylomonas montana TaxID=3058963 RepID=UPI00265B4766|nr:carboxypeptidase regulatory-like domain-containing protein [Methylomonas montana]WKJ88887.1 TonB-dependent receptor [Methylomonas montana]
MEAPFNIRIFHRLLPATVGMLLAITGPAKQASADISAATIRGQIQFDTLGGNAGAQVIVTSLERGFSTRTFSRQDGSYVLMALKPGRYQLKVLAPDGRQTSQEITLQVGQVADVNIVLSESNAGEPLADHAAEGNSAELATYLTPEQMQRLPQVNRNFLNYADLAPGVNVVTDQDGSTRLQSGGQRPDAVNLFIDGVSQKNYVVRGGVAGQDSSRGNVFPESAVAEYKVISQNYKAEFDQVGAAAISVQTKTGGNQFHGEAFYDHTNQDLRAVTPAEQLGGGKRDTEQAQYGVTLSGPIAKDVAHFFMAYERKLNDDYAAVAAGDGSVLPAQYQALLGNVNRPFEEDLFFGKLDWAIDDRNLIEVSFKLRDETETLGIGGQNAQPYALEKGNSEKRLDFKYQYSAEHWVNEARFTYEDANWRQSPASQSAGLLLRRLNGRISDGDLSSLAVLNTGGATNYQDKGQRGPGFQDDLTFSGLQWYGEHVFKLGGKLKQIELGAVERDPYHPQFSFNLNNPGGSPYQVRWATALAGFGDGSASTDLTQVGLYLQDDWAVNRHLSLNLGARWDYEYNPGYLNFVTPTDVSSALRGWSNLSHAGYNIENYLSNGANRAADNNNIAPRLGFAYDLDQDRRHVLFGGYARAYDRNIYDVLQLERTKGSYPSYSVNFQDDPNYDCIAGVDCIAWNPDYINYTPVQLAALTGASLGSSREINLMRNNLRTPYADQFSIGFRNRLGDWNTELAVSHVHSYDGLVGLLGGRNADGSFYAAGSGFGGTFQAVPGYGQLILFDNGVQTKTNSVFLKAEKPYSKDSGWGMTFAYTFTDSEENKSQSFMDSSSYLLEHPDTHTLGWLDTAGVRKHKVVATGTVDLPWDLIFSTKLTLATPETRAGVNCSGGACRFDTFTPPGSDFIFPGQWWGYKQVDIALIKSFDTPRDTRMKLRLDVLNLFDFKNYSTFNSDFASASLGSPLTVLAGPGMTLKLTARLEF